MILRGIELIDFGLYGGTTQIDLVPRRQHGRQCPIILIGGKNGAGKTTLLDAVRLALYGRRALGTRVGQSEYESYLRDRIHRKGGIRSAAVGLDFDYAEAGRIHRYRVRRQWVDRGRSVAENLVLEKDGAAISSVPREEWHYFLQELIPPGVSQLFFFDGEKVREIADSEGDNEQLAEAVRGLLGIDLVARLRTDLGLFLARHNRENEPTRTSQLEAVIRNFAQLERRAESLSDEIAELRSVRESQARAAEQMRRRFIAEGGDAAARRGRVEGEREEVLRSLSRCEHELRNLANGLLPFAVAPRLVSQFRRDFGHSGTVQDRQAQANAIQVALSAWRTGKPASPDRKAEWTTRHWNDLRRFLTHWSESGRVTKNLAFRELGDGRTALACLVEIETTTRPRARALLREFDSLSRRLAQLDTDLARADNAAAGVLLDELGLADQKVGSAEAALQAKEGELKEIRGRLVTLERQRKHLLDEEAGLAAAADRAALATRTAQALAVYEQRLLEQKLAQLKVEFVRRFNDLARKVDLIADVRFSVETLAATLIDADGRELLKAALSAGEKQVYAISMLWAMARTSGRPLPMIIDTPLARLDSEHRTNLIQRYFPAASHQVILLSTDTEVDEALARSLGRCVSHAYRLDYDPHKGRTIVSPGYFGEGSEPMEDPGRALQQA